MARPTKWTKAMQDDIVADTRKGVRPEVAAGARGIVRSTYFEWMAAGTDGGAGVAGFRTAIDRARDDWERQATEAVLAGDEKGASFGPAKATLEVLSRRLPRQWAQQVKHHVETVEDEFFSALDEIAADPNVLARILETKDLRVFVVAFCEVLARRESEGETPVDSGGRAIEPMH
jgi:hypothetical protein